MEALTDSAARLLEDGAKILRCKRELAESCETCLLPKECLFSIQFCLRPGDAFETPEVLSSLRRLISRSPYRQRFNLGEPSS